MLLDLPRTTQLSSVCVVLPVINEKVSLVETVRLLEANPLISEYLLVVCEKTRPSSLEICQKFHEQNPARFLLLKQKLPFLGGAIREAFERASSSHVVMMASDLETDPETVPDMIEAARQYPETIVTASRWLRGCRFQGYNHAKLAANYVFQKVFSFFYGVRLSDMTYGFRIFPTALVQGILWEELKHPFLLETLLKPLRLGVKVIEIPSSWRLRREGESQNTLFDTFDYSRVALRLLFQPPERFLVSHEKGYCHHNN